MKAARFAYAQPDTIQDACDLLARHGEDARILAGGQSLDAMLNMRLVTPSIVVDINRTKGIHAVELGHRFVVTGAAVRQADALRHAAIAQHVPLLQYALPYVGHYQTRSRGTLAGSVAHADPSAEIPLVLFVLDGEVELRAKRRERTVRAREFFQSALVTARRPDEMIVALHWPRAAAASWFGFREFAFRAGDYAIVVAACELRLTAEGAVDRLSLAYGGCADRPQLVDPQSFLRRPFDQSLAAEIARAAEQSVHCKGDLHASARYRQQLVRTLAEELFADALAATPMRS